MALTAMMKISGADGESIMSTSGDPNAGAKVPNGSYKGWIELQGWDWEVEAETSWTKGGGASVGKPNPGKMNWEHYFDTSSNVILKYIFSGQAFDEIELHMLKSTGKLGMRVFFKMIMKGAFITKVTNNATEEGNVVQKVEMVFKEVKFHYAPQISKGETAGTLGGFSTVGWDIPAGTVS